MKTRDDPISPVTLRPQEIDFFGLTHIGKVRDHNEDQFLIVTLHKHMVVQATSLATTEGLPLTSDPVAYLALVADGLGGHAAGEEASRLVAESVVEFVTQSMGCYYGQDPAQEETFLRDLQEAAIRGHLVVVSEAFADRTGMATTLTLVVVIWPRAYVVQVGDSRLYLMGDGELMQITTDQTVAQEMHDRGIISTGTMRRSPLRNVLSSAIGGKTAAPVVSLAELKPDDVLLLCSDGLTDHVSDERIAERIEMATTAEDAARTLLQDALDGGGSDNITLVVGRFAPR